MIPLKENYVSIDYWGKIARGKSKHRPRNAPELYNGKYPFIQTGEIKHANMYISTFSQTYNEKGLAQSKLWEPNTLCITIAANIAETAILKIKACFPDSIIGFVSDGNKSDIHFVKYCFDSYKLQIQAISQGTTQDNLSLEKLRTIKFKKTPLPIQKKIAAILSAYDELIENNNHRISILEKMAEETYKEWFVRMRFPGHKKTNFIKGIPENWEIKRLVDFINFDKGIEPGSNNYQEYKTDENVPFLRVGSLNKRETDIFVNKSLAKNKFIKKDDILITMDGTVGLVKFGFEGCYSSGIRKVSFHDNVLPKWYVYLLLKSYTIQNIIYQHATGSTILHASSCIKHLKFIYSNSKLLNKFSQYITPTFEKIIILQKINQKLKQTRDLLLPRLISGKLDVENLDIAFPPGMQEMGNSKIKTDALS